MTLKPVISALLAASLIAGCVQEQASFPLSTSGAAPAAAVPQLAIVDGRKVPSGLLCEHLIDRAVNSVSGCEGYVKLSGLSTRQAAEIASLNSRFAAEVSPIVNFEFGKATLTPAAQAILDVQAAWMRRFVNLRFSVYGHTDLVGSEGYNFDLAKRRAEGVVAYLAGRGVPSDQLEALVSYGEAKPLIPASGREALNRRTVTQVTNYVTVPVLRTAVDVSCSLIQPVYLASYPHCLSESKPAVVPPAPPLPAPIIVGNDVAQNTVNGTGTSVSITYTTDSKTTDLNAYAGDGISSSTLSSVETKDKIVREFQNNGQDVMRVRQDASGNVLGVEIYDAAGGVVASSGSLQE
ncbi:MAG: OmpA family protein [Rhodobacteraceae bacterium]|nr:OmpA family protein [Paracoccaceae bacterium]